MNSYQHTFHIPVMGLSYTVDTPIKIAKYGITSVVSIVQDELVERARKYYSSLNNLPFTPISKKDPEYRSKRITAYLNLSNELVKRDFEALKNDPEELTKYARMLPGNVTLEELRANLDQLKPGKIDVNIMTKLDRQPSENDDMLTEASSAVKGFADSDLEASIVLSAGLNPRLFSFMENLEDFFPDGNGQIKKKIVLKVSDYRSSLIQGKMLAKKGLWVSEYRIESGLNCGGHTFATDGLLMGPILEEFKKERDNLFKEQETICREAWERMDKLPAKGLELLVTVQGGIGTSAEREMLEEMYDVHATGWGSPFLLVPEATSIDDQTLKELSDAGEDDIYNSGVSPLGVSFNTIRNNSADQWRKQNIENGKPGFTCHQKHLALDNSVEKTGICTASVKYQKRKIEELKSQNLDPETYQKAFDKIVEKECLCDGLSNSFYKKFNLSARAQNEGVSVCPGPNLAYFDRTYSLEEMVGHIYGKNNVVEMERPHLFIKELGLYVEHFEKLHAEADDSPKTARQLKKFEANLLAGIKYYEDIASEICAGELQKFKDSLNEFKIRVQPEELITETV